jgi:hypothetical protein
VMFRRQYERALRMLWEHRDRQRDLSAPAAPSQPQDRNFTKRTETRPAETEPRGSSPKGCDRAVQTQPPQPPNTPPRAAGATSPPHAQTGPHGDSPKGCDRAVQTQPPQPPNTPPPRRRRGQSAASPNGFPAALGRRLHSTRAPSRKPLPRNNHPNPKPHFYETNRNSPCRNRAAREQPEGLRPSGSDTTSPTFRHPTAPQARPGTRPRHRSQALAPDPASGRQGRKISCARPVSIPRWFR